MAKSKKRIHFVGAQGTGKTTILNHYKEQGYNVITEIVRNLAKEGVNINEMGDVDGQKKIFSSYQKLLKSTTILKSMKKDVLMNEVYIFFCQLSSLERETKIEILTKY